MGYRVWSTWQNVEATTNDKHSFCPHFQVLCLCREHIHVQLTEIPRQPCELMATVGGTLFLSLLVIVVQHRTHKMLQAVGQTSPKLVFLKNMESGKGVNCCLSRHASRC